eukprot:jgi/Mesvir1/21526/Mv03968-RA.1
MGISSWGVFGSRHQALRSPQLEKTRSPLPFFSKAPQKWPRTKESARRQANYSITGRFLAEPWRNHPLVTKSFEDEFAAFAETLEDLPIPPSGQRVDIVEVDAGSSAASPVKSFYDLQRVVSALRFARAAKRARVNAPIVAGDAPVDGDVAGASDARPKSPRADVDCELVGEIVTASSGEKFVVAE